MNSQILTCNAGSNSLKCAVFDSDSMTLVYRFSVERIHDQANLSVSDAQGKNLLEKETIESGYRPALTQIMKWNSKNNGAPLIGIGHRIVHGGRHYNAPVLISNEVKRQIKKLIPLAPLHQPYNFQLIETLQQLHPELPQIACFDTAFHRNQSKVVQDFALPYALSEDEGIVRYGFHGLSYEYILQRLRQDHSSLSAKKLIVAHLGSGASLCAIKDNKSFATTMGFSALDGLMMGTRSGNIDPGVLLYLLQEKGMQVETLQNLLYQESGLIGVSGISSDMRDLEKSEDIKAKQAINLFCFTAAKQMGGLITVMGGIDALVFTGAMGVGSRLIREKIVSYLNWLHIHIDEQRNAEHQTYISTNNSAAKVMIIHTDEEKIIAQHTKQVLAM